MEATTEAMATAVRRLGRSGVEVSPLGLGCWAIGGPWSLFGNPGGWGEVDDDESIRAIHAGLDAGINFLDTAATYGAGHSERVLARALRGRRDEVVLATKFGFVVDEARKTVERYESDELVVRNLRADCEASLARLETDYIDLFQFHVWDYPIASAVAVREELEALVRDGKIRSYAWSTDSVDGARVFAEGEHCTAVQHDLNVVMDAAGMLDLCEQQDLASVNRSPLARGALTGKYRRGKPFASDDVRQEQWSVDTFFTPTLDVLDALREILTSEGRTLAQGALAWIWARSERTIPIPGFRNPAQVEENAGAVGFGPLEPRLVAEIDTLLGR